MESIFAILQFGIYFIIAIMFGLVGLYIYLTKSSSSNKYNYNQTNLKNDNEQNFEEDIMDEYNPKSDDDGPIQNL